MRISFLGNWSAKTSAGKTNTSFVIDERIACDFGPSSLQAMLDKGLDPNDLDTVLISHMHFDHFGGLTGLLWYRAMSNNRGELKVIGPAGIGKVTRNLLQNYSTPGGFQIYASFYENDPDGQIEVFSGEHSIPDNGYRISRGSRTIFYSGDTGYSESMVKGSEDADLLVHEMTYPDELKIEANLWKHSTVSDALSVFQNSNAKRFVPVHLTEETMKMIPTLQRKIDQLFSPEGNLIL